MEGLGLHIMKKEVALEKPKWEDAGKIMPMGEERAEASMEPVILAARICAAHSGVKGMRGCNANYIYVGPEEEMVAEEEMAVRMVAVAGKGANKTQSRKSIPPAMQ